MKLLFAFLVLTISLHSQDIDKYNSGLSFNGILYPSFIGGGILGSIEYGFDEKNAISIGVKINAVQFIPIQQYFNAQMILVDYKRYFNTKENYHIFISPYMKFRKMNYREQSDRRTHSNYEDNSICIGLQGGLKSTLGKKDKFYFTTFFGGGYFFPITFSGNTRASNTVIGDFVPGFIYRHLDLRGGIVFGYSFRKYPSANN